MKHTPGPWLVNGPWHIQASTISSEKNLPRIVAQAIAGHYVTFEEREANATLIAAAPALLNALLQAKQVIDALPYEQKVAVPGISKIIREALALAEAPCKDTE